MTKRARVFSDIEFWKGATEDAMVDAYATLVGYGVPPEEAEDLLKSLYFAVGGEYGA